MKNTYFLSWCFAFYIISSCLTLSELTYTLYVYWTPPTVFVTGEGSLDLQLPSNVSRHDTVNATCEYWSNTLKHLVWTHVKVLKGNCLINILHRTFLKEEGYCKTDFQILDITESCLFQCYYGRNRVTKKIHVIGKNWSTTMHILIICMQVCIVEWS